MSVTRYDKGYVAALIVMYDCKPRHHRARYARALLRELNEPRLTAALTTARRLLAHDTDDTVTRLRRARRDGGNQRAREIAARILAPRAKELIDPAKYCGQCQRFYTPTPDQKRRHKHGGRYEPAGGPRTRTSGRAPLRVRSVVSGGLPGLGKRR